VGCGQGNEPLASLGDPSSQYLSTFQLPLNVSTISFSSFVAYSSSTPYWQFNSNNYTSSTTIVAPASGEVIYADSGTQTIKIMHNSYTVSVIVGVTPSSVTPGTYVTAGAQIGTLQSLYTFVKFQILINGTAVCPLSYLTSTARGQLSTYFYSVSGYSNSGPCTQ
jgi:murein DD-endopeptidase MepM/ murein hydrolase activator NlpD